MISPARSVMGGDYIESMEETEGRDGGIGMLSRIFNPGRRTAGSLSDWAVLSYSQSRSCRDNTEQRSNGDAQRSLAATSVTADAVRFPYTSPARESTVR